MKSSSESIPVVCGDSGRFEGLDCAVGATAEAILLFDDVSVSSKGDIASAAFLFFAWGGMVSTNEGELGLARNDHQDTNAESRLCFRTERR